MIQLIVPRFFENYNFYNLLQEFIRTYPKKIKFDINLLMTGSFPNTCWNGGINSIYKNTVLYNELNKILNNTNIPIILDFSNCLLEEQDINDVYGNLILKMGNSGGHMVLLTSPILHTYIIQNYSEYNCILSKNTFYIYNIQDINHFNEVINSSQFKFIELPIHQNTNEEFLSSIKKPNKIIVSLMNKCNSCSNLSDCILLENNFQINYSSKTVLDKCPQQSNNYFDENIIEKAINYYQKFFIDTFQLDSPNEDNIETFKSFLIINIIKKEYIEDFYQFLKNKEKLL